MWQLLGILLLLNAKYGSSHLQLIITPFGKEIVLEENVDLNLTCRVLTKEKIRTKFELSWKLPSRFNSPAKSNSNGDRITVDQARDELTVTIHNLQEDDSGVYMCKLQDRNLIWTQKINVLVRSKKCMQPFFDCGGGLCIAKNYVCDGFRDCPNGYDEDFKYCGPDACHGKILCNKRCISKELCCDPLTDANCTANYIMPCCHNILQTREINPSSPCSPPEDCNYGHYLGFGNSILYVVASCAGVVMVVSTAIMFLACRICSKHSEELHRWARVPANRMHRQYLQEVTTMRHESDSTDNIDFLFEDVNSDGYHGNSGSETADDFVLCTFVPGSGYQVIGSDPKPPPYTEYAIGIPPPPYESNSDISESQKNTATETVALAPTANSSEQM